MGSKSKSKSKRRKQLEDTTDDDSSSSPSLSFEESESSSKRHRRRKDDSGSRREKERREKRRSKRETKRRKSKKKKRVYGVDDDNESGSGRSGDDSEPDRSRFEPQPVLRQLFIEFPNVENGLKQIANAVNRGELVPEEIICGLLSKRLEDGYCKGESGFILDGIPRSRIQAEILSELIEIDLVVDFKCTKHCLVKHEREGAWREKLRNFAGQRYDPDPGAKADAATVLASKLGTDSGLKFYVGDESKTNVSTGKSHDVELVHFGELRNRKLVHTRSNSTGSVPLNFLKKRHLILQGFLLYKFEQER